MKNLNETFNSIDVARYLEYLNNDKIQNIKCIFEDNIIKITSPSTDYVTMNNPTLITKNELMQIIKDIQTTAKADNRIKIKGISNIKKIIDENYQEYYNNMIIKDYLFQQAKIKLQDFINNIGLNYGYGDDILFKTIRNDFVVPFNNIDTHTISKCKNNLIQVKSQIEFLSEDISEANFNIMAGL